MKKSWMVGLSLLGLLSILAMLSSDAAEREKALTQANVQFAFNAGSSAQTKYAAYAEGAEKEGYKSVAALFRALSRAKAIQTAKYASLLHDYGVDAKPAAVPAELKSTGENLEAAIKTENTGATVIYPEFVKQAQQDKNARAAIIFRRTAITTKEQVRLCRTALKDLADWKSPDKTFLVCPGCGYISMDKAIKKCNVCAASGDIFEKIR